MSYSQILNKHMIKGLFPRSFQHVKFAFIGEHIDRYQSIVKPKQRPVFDIIMAVDDVLSFHKNNLQDNKEHYTYFVRMLKGKPALWLHQYGAKMLFNTISINESQIRDLNQYVSQQTDDTEINQEKILEIRQQLEQKYSQNVNGGDQYDDLSQIKFRYGVIGIDDLIRDLKFWETLLVSSMMQRPITRLITANDNEFNVWSNYQLRNLKSALAFAILTNPSRVSEERFYQKIVEIPQYDSIIGKILDKEDEQLLVKENLEEFRILYRPLIDEYFSEIVKISEDKGIMEINNQSQETRIQLMSHLNDNVFQNIEHKYQYDAKLYSNKDSDNRTKYIKKDPLEIDEKVEIANDFVQKNSLEKQINMLQRSLDKILVTHRNSKLFLFMLSGPFFVLFYFSKLTLKLVVMYLIYGTVKKAKKPKQETDAEISNKKEAAAN